MTSEQKMMRLQVLQNSLQKLEQREKLLIQGLEDLERTKLALQELKGSEGQAFVPVGANNFVKGNIEDSENVLVSIGAGIAVKKTRENALKLSESRIAEFRKEAEKTMEDMKKMGAEFQNLQTELQAMQK